MPSTNSPSLRNRLVRWFHVDPPTDTTYASVLWYLARIAPRYGLGLVPVVAYNVYAHGLDAAVVFAGTGIAATAALVAGLALRWNDRLYAVLAGTAAVATQVGTWRVLEALGDGMAAIVLLLGSWIVLVLGLIGYALLEDSVFVTEAAD